MLLYEKEKCRKKIRSSPLQSRQTMGNWRLSNVVRTGSVRWLNGLGVFGPCTHKKWHSSINSKQKKNGASSPQKNTVAGEEVRVDFCCPIHANSGIFSWVNQWRHKQIALHTCFLACLHIYMWFAYLLACLLVA